MLLAQVQFMAMSAQSNVELPELNGALVLAVGPDTPAAKSGFRKFDLIQELDGQPVKTAADAQAIVDASKVGQTLSVRIVRANKPVSLSIVTGDLSQKAGPSAASKGARE